MTCTTQFYIYKGDEPGPSGRIEGRGIRSSGRYGDSESRGDVDDYNYEVLTVILVMFT